MAVEKWEVPRTISELRAFLGFTNYYSSYVKGYAEVVARLQDKLRVSRADGKKGSKLRISWDKDDQYAFDEIKNGCVRSSCFSVLTQTAPSCCELTRAHTRWVRV